MINLPAIFLPGYYLSMFLLKGLLFLFGYDPVMFSIVTLGALAIFAVLFTKSGRLWFLLLATLLHSTAYSRGYEDWRDYQPQKENRVLENAYKFSKEALDGSVRGDFIDKPSFANRVGNALVYFTPAYIIANARDFVANFNSSFKTDFKEHKTELALSAVGFVPIFKEIEKLEGAVQAGRNAAREARAVRELGELSLVRESLPKALDYVAKSFEGEVRLRTFKQGEILYRSPREAEAALNPGRYFGTRLPVTEKGADSLWNNVKYGNTNELIRKYEFKQPVTVYYGKIKDGSGYQIYIPDDVDPSKILKWVGYKELR